MISFVREGLPDQIKDLDKIHVTLEDSSRLATNGLPINENVYITDHEFKFFGDQLEKRGMKVEHKISRSFGEAFRCNKLRCNILKNQLFNKRVRLYTKNDRGDDMPPKSQSESNFRGSFQSHLFLLF